MPSTPLPPPPNPATDDPLPGYTRHKVSEEDVEAPAYPLEELSRGRPPLDPAAVEASAPKPRPPRWWQFWRASKRAKIIMAVVVLALVGLVAAMIWYGVHTAYEKREHPADLSAAKNLVVPQVPTSLNSNDGDLLTSFEFSPPTISNRSFSSFTNSVNATILTSTSQLIQLPTPVSSSSYFLKIFGNRSTDIVFRSSLDNSTREWTAQVSAFWKVSPGGNQEERSQWGVDLLSKTVGGSYGYRLDSSGGDGAVGFALEPFGNDTFQVPYYTVGSYPDKWVDSSMLFNVTIFVPPGSYARSLEIFSTAMGDLNFRDLNNSTFDLIDVRMPLGWVGTNNYGFPLATRLLKIFAGTGIVGSYSLASGTLISHGTIQPIFSFPPTTIPSASSPYNLTLITTDGYISANITSISLSSSYSSSPGINLDATSLSPDSNYGGGIKVYMPFQSYNGTFELATNNGAAVAANAEQVFGSGVGWQSFGGKPGFAGRNGKVQKKLSERIRPSGKGRVRLNTEAGDVGLSIGPGDFARI